MIIEQILKEADESQVRLYMSGEKLKAQAPTGQFPQSLQKLIVENKQQLIDYLLDNGGFALTDSNTGELSYSQKRMWFEDKLSQGSAHYNIQHQMLLKGAFCEASFKKTLSTLFERHKVLKSCIKEVNNEPRLLEIHDFQLPYFYKDLSALSQKDQKIHAERLAEVQYEKAFDLSQDAMLRVLVLPLLENATLVIFTFHHIACDGWSINVFNKELNLLYESYKAGQDNPLEPLKIEYNDFVTWQKNWLKGGALNHPLEYWKEQLSNLPQVHNLPLDKPRPQQRSFIGRVVEQSISSSLTQKIRKECQKQQVTLFMFLHTAFSIFLARYSNEDDIVVGVPVSGRDHKDLEPLIGYFINSIVLRSKVSKQLTFNKLLNNNKRMVLDAFDNQHLPFEMLVEELRPKRDPRYNPLFQVAFQLMNFADKKADKPEGNQLDKYTDELDKASIKGDLELHVSENINSLKLNWIFSEDLFEQSTMLRMNDNFMSLLESIVDGFDCLTKEPPSIEQLNIISKRENAKLMHDANVTDDKSFDLAFFHELFESQAEKSPQAIAVAFEGSSLNYRELNRLSNQVAHYLRTKGIGPEDKVGSYFTKSLDMIVCVLAILKSGACYVPLNPSFPKDRLEYTVKDSDCQFVFIDKALADSTHLFNDQSIVVDADFYDNVLNEYSADNLSISDIGLTHDNLAYSIYTSGSTGKPKGVLLTHRCLAQFTHSSKSAFSFSEKDSFIQYHSISFDVSVFEITSSLAHGLTLHLISEEKSQSADELTKLVIEQHITHLALPQSMLSLLDRNTLSSIKHLFVGGEALASKLANKWCQHVNLYNAYGPTETTVCSTLSLHKSGETNIGRPLQHVTCYVLDEYHQMVPTGVTGELYLAGPSLARGYMNLPAKTASSFIPNPFSHRSGERLYRTGDLVKWSSNGTLKFVGRADNQVKLRGFRIELEEIESVLVSHLAIDNAVVTVQCMENGSDHLVTYLLLETQTKKELTISDLKNWLAKRLPHYMVPDIYIVIEEFPLTQNGKIDKDSLPKATGKDFIRKERITPNSNLEKQLCLLWQDLLKIDAIGINEDFFELGGHSLLAIKLINLINKKLKKKLPVSALFQHPTVESLSVYINAAVNSYPSNDNNLILPLSYQEQLPTVYILLGLGMTSLTMKPLSEALKASYNTNILLYPGLELEFSSDTNFDQLVLSYKELINTTQPEGDITLAGHSIGGSLAYALAVSLLASGRSVSLVLLDSFFDFELLEHSLDEYRDSLLKSSASKDSQKREMHNILQKQYQIFENFAPAADFTGKVTAVFANQGLAGNANVFEKVKKRYLSQVSPDVRFIFSEGGHLSMFDQHHAAGLAEKIIPCFMPKQQIEK